MGTDINFIPESELKGTPLDEERGQRQDVQHQGRPLQPEVFSSKLTHSYVLEDTGKGSVVLNIAQAPGGKRRKSQRDSMFNFSSLLLSYKLTPPFNLWELNRGERSRYYLFFLLTARSYLQ